MFVFLIHDPRPKIRPIFKVPSESHAIWIINYYSTIIAFYDAVEEYIMPTCKLSTQHYGSTCIQFRC